MAGKAQNSHYYAGLQSKISQEPETTFHFGYAYTFNLGKNNYSTTQNRNSVDLAELVFTVTIFMERIISILPSVVAITTKTSALISR